MGRVIPGAVGRELPGGKLASWWKDSLSVEKELLVGRELPDEKGASRWE